MKDDKKPRKDEALGGRKKDRKKKETDAPTTRIGGRDKDRGG